MTTPWAPKGAAVLIGAQGELILRGDYASTDRSSGAYKPTGLTTTGAPAPLAGLVNLPQTLDNEHLLPGPLYEAG